MKKTFEIEFSDELTEGLTDLDFISSGILVALRSSPQFDEGAIVNVTDVTKKSTILNPRVPIKRNLHSNL